MKILKKKIIGTFEVYMIFLGWIYAGYMTYISLSKILISKFIFWADLTNFPPSWSSSSFEKKNKKNIPNDAMDKEIDKADNSSIT